VNGGRSDGLEPFGENSGVSIKKEPAIEKKKEV
jgi:hypothetical protein